MLCRPALLLAVVLAAAFVNPLAAQGGRTAASPIIFNGLLVQDGKTEVGLYNPNTGETKWVQVGKSYGNYTVGYEPALPATKQTPATKDTVLLTLGGNVQRIQLQEAAITPVVTTGAGSVQSLEAASFAVLAALKDRLAQARSDPNADPRLIQELELSIAQQQQKIADDRKWVMSHYSTDYNGHREDAIHTTTADGQHVVIFEDGQQFTVPPGQIFLSISNDQPVFSPDEPHTRDFTSVNGQLILTTDGQQFTVPPDQVFIGYGNGMAPVFEPAPAPYTVPPGQVVDGFNGLQQPLFAPIPDDATSYHDHGLAKNARGDFDGAIADYNQALALNPSYAEAYWDRGQARFSKDDFNGALADLDRALALNPNLAGAYGSRGAAKEAKGDLTGALADYDKSIALAKDEAAYPRFFRFLTLRRLHRDAGQADLARVVAKWQDGWWAKTVGLYLSGALPEKDFLAQAASPAWRMSEQQCEAYYYVGMTRLIAGDTAAARNFFEKCLATNVTTFFEFTFARAQLARLAGQK